MTQPTVNLNFCEDRRSLANGTHNHAQKTIRTTQSRVNERSDTNETAWHSELKVIGFRMQRYNSRKQRATSAIAVGIFGDDTRSNFDFLAKLDHQSNKGKG